MDLLEIAKNFGIPAIGAFAGWLSAAAAYKHRLAQVEKDFGKFKEDQKETHTKEEEGLKEKLDKLERLLDRVTSEIRSDLLKKFEDLEQEVAEIDKAFNRFERASAHDFAKDAEFAHFIEEQNKQWQAVHRLLGQIEGILRSQRRWSSRPPSMNSR